MSNRFETAVFYLSDFLGDHDAAQGELTITLSFTEPNDRARFLYAIKKSFEAYLLYPNISDMKPHEFQFNGIKFKVPATSR